LSSKKITNAVFSFFVISLLLLSGFGNAAAASFPNKPVKIVVPYSAGGAADLTTRLTAKVAEKYLGQPIVIENRGGGGGVTGQNIGANAKPDGYTLTEVSTSTILNPLTKKVNYTSDSFTYIANMVQDIETIVINKDEGIKDYDAFVKFAKAHPKAIKVGVSGSYNSDHLAAIIWAEKAGIELVYVPFNGSAKANAALLGGHVNMVLASPAELSEQEKAGEVVYIASMGAKHFPDYPGLPTLKDKGIDLVMGPFRGLAAPAGTPDEIIAVLEKAFTQALNSEELHDAFIKAGLPADTHLNRKDFVEMVDSYKVIYKDFVEEYGIGK